MSAAKCLLSLMVVLVAAGCAVHAHDRIKICGRELIRLAVSSCGNPRLRRSLSDIELQQHHFTYFFPHFQGGFGFNANANGRYCVYRMGKMLILNKTIERQPVTFNPQLFFLFHLHCTGDHSTSMKEQVASEMIHIPSEYDEDDFVSLAAHWFPMSSRMRRSAAKISDICCEKGCSLQELIQFC
uniref:Insulin-like 3 n=1 Tax=Sphaeramia orbicularis TaxID=375764 RepID=A0A673CE40_9TELE